MGVRTIEERDADRDTTFPCEIWYPAAGADPSAELRDAEPAAGAFPLVLFSHHSGGNRRSATYLTTHLASHGYVVAALDHSEVVAPGLARQVGETAEQRAARAHASIANRVPDIRFLLDRVLSSQANLDPAQIGIVGHSFGGWTALAAPEVESRIKAVVALAPGGASNPKPGILPLTLAFNWSRDIPTLYLVAENDVPLPIDGMYELFERTGASKQMVILRRADHLHFIDNMAAQHEAMRAMSIEDEWSWIPKAMRPISELCSGDQAQLFVRGLTLCHMDANLKPSEDARRFLAGDIKSELAARGVEAMVHHP